MPPPFPRQTARSTQPYPTILHPPTPAGRPATDPDPRSNRPSATKPNRPQPPARPPPARPTATVLPSARPHRMLHPVWNAPTEQLRLFAPARRCPSLTPDPPQPHSRTPGTSPASPARHTRTRRTARPPPAGAAAAAAQPRERMMPPGTWRTAPPASRTALTHRGRPSPPTPAVRSAACTARSPSWACSSRPAAASLGLPPADPWTDAATAHRLLCLLRADEGAVLRLETRAVKRRPKPT